MRNKKKTGDLSIQAIAGTHVLPVDIGRSADDNGC